MPSTDLQKLQLILTIENEDIDQVKSYSFTEDLNGFMPTGRIVENSTIRYTGSVNPLFHAIQAGAKLEIIEFLVKNTSKKDLIIDNHSAFDTAIKNYTKTPNKKYLRQVITCISENGFRDHNRSYDNNYMEYMADCQNDEGIAAFKRKDYKSAINIFNIITGLYPSADKFYNRGSAYLSLKDFFKATTDLEQAVLMNPKYEKALKKLMLSYAELSNLKRLQGESKEEQEKFIKEKKLKYPKYSDSMDLELAKIEQRQERQLKLMQAIKKNNEEFVVNYEHVEDFKDLLETGFSRTYPYPVYNLFGIFKNRVTPITTIPLLHAINEGASIKIIKHLLKNDCNEIQPGSLADQFLTQTRLSIFAFAIERFKKHKPGSEKYKEAQEIIELLILHDVKIDKELDKDVEKFVLECLSRKQAAISKELIADPFFYPNDIADIVSSYCLEYNANPELEKKYQNTKGNRLKADEYNKEGVTFFKKNDFKQAFVSFANSVNILAYAENLYNLGSICMKLGDWKEAVLHLSKSMIIDNKNEESNNKAKTEAKAKRITKSYEKMAECYVNMNDKQKAAQTYCEEASLYKEQNKKEEALKCINKALEIDSNNPNVVAIAKELGVKIEGKWAQSVSSSRFTQTQCRTQ